VSCIKGREKQTVGELYELFDSLASEMWPEEPGRDADGTDLRSQTESLSIEDQIAKEVSAMKRPRKEQRFVNCQTNTSCVVFISCKPPVDPVKLVTAHIRNVQATGVIRTRYTHRFVPVSGSCVANPPEIQALCHSILTPFFAQNPGKLYRYKIELRVRNHTTLARPTIIEQVAACVPQEHTVDLTNPEVFILVEVFKSICGVSIVKDYYKLQKFNVVEIASRVDREIVITGERVSIK